MRILERGNAQLQWPRQIVTTCCGSVLEIDPQDIHRDSDYTGGFNGYYIDCPVCGEQPAIENSVKMAGDRWLRQQERVKQ